MIIRPLTVFEREAVRNFYLALSPDGRRKRFCGSLSDGTISSYVDGLNFTRDAILGAFNEQAQIIGLAELVRGGDIGFERLLAYPTAKRCFICQRQHEKTYVQEANPKL